MLTYSYDVKNLADGGINQMRFELGDTMVEEPSKTAYLSDEEIQASITAYHGLWKRAKLALVGSLLARFSYEVDTRSGPVEWSLSQRYEVWRRMYDELKSEVRAEGCVPTMAKGGFKPPYFSEGMHASAGCKRRREGFVFTT